jgi:hypothetical protein
MPANLLDMAAMTVSGTPSTGTITLLAAVPGYQTFANAGAINGRTYSYSARDAGSVWEVGRGTYASAGPTITRGPLNGSSGANTAVSLTSGAVVMLAILVEDVAPTLYRPHSFNGCPPFP